MKRINNKKVDHLKQYSFVNEKRVHYSCFKTRRSRIIYFVSIYYAQLEHIHLKTHILLHRHLSSAPPTRCFPTANSFPVEFLFRKPSSAEVTQKSIWSDGGIMYHLTLASFQFAILIRRRQLTQLHWVMKDKLVYEVTCVPDQHAVNVHVCPCSRSRPSCYVRGWRKLFASDNCSVIHSVSFLGLTSVMCRRECWNSWILQAGWRLQIRAEPSAKQDMRFELYDSYIWRVLLFYLYFEHIHLIPHFNRSIAFLLRSWHIFMFILCYVFFVVLFLIIL